MKNILEDDKNSRIKKLNYSNKKMEITGTDIKDLQLKQEYFYFRKGQQNASINFCQSIVIAGIGYNSIYISIFQTIIVIFLNIWEIYYIEKMLDYRESV